MQKKKNDSKHVEKGHTSFSKNSEVLKGQMILTYKYEFFCNVQKMQPLLPSSRKNHK